jgi:hypothetical protein
MTHARKMSPVLGIATLTTFGLAAIQPAHAQISGISSSSFTTHGTTTSSAGVTSASSQTQINSGTLTLTDGGAAEASSAWYNTRQSITDFNTSFTYRVINPSSTSSVQYGVADGFGFVLQNAGLNAIGGNGGADGYASSSTNGVTTPAITTSAAQTFEMYGGETTVLQQNGTAGTSISLSPIILNSGDPLAVSFLYNGTTLFGQVRDTTTGAFTSFSSAVNLQTLTGGSTAYVGFTGGDGGATSTQQVSNFAYSPASTAAAASPTPIAITGLTSDVIKGTASDSTNSAFDAPNNYALYAAAADATNGLPNNGTITSATGSGTTFQLGSYTGNNALLLSNTPTITINSGSGTNPATGGTTYSYSQYGTITLVTAAKYSTISLLTASTNGTATLNITFNYVGGGTATATLLTKDWYTTTGSTATSMGRVNASSGTFDTGGTGGPHLYESLFTVDPTQTLSSISFAESATGTNTVAGIFAVSGIAAAPEPGEIAGMLMGGLGLLGLAARKRRLNA